MSFIDAVKKRIPLASDPTPKADVSKKDFEDLETESAENASDGNQRDSGGSGEQENETEQSGGESGEQEDSSTESEGETGEEPEQGENESSSDDPGQSSLNQFSDNGDENETGDDNDGDTAENEGDSDETSDGDEEGDGDDTETSDREETDGEDGSERADNDDNDETSDGSDEGDEDGDLGREPPEIDGNGEEPGDDGDANEDASDGSESDEDGEGSEENGDNDGTDSGNDDENAVEPDSEPDEDPFEPDSELVENEKQRNEKEKKELGNELEQARQELEKLNQALSNDSGNGGLSNVKFNIDPDSTSAAGSRWNEAYSRKNNILALLSTHLNRERRDSWKRGQNKGRLDSKSLHKVPAKRLDVMKQRDPGKKKKYSAIIVLDRSGSMSGEDITIAEDALVTYALALEELGIDVMVMDMYRNDARVISPFGVSIEQSKDDLMSQETGGGTPLSDVLEVARKRMELASEEPFLITITDGRPNSPDQYQNQLSKTYMPVMGITIDQRSRYGSRDTRSGSHDQYYDTHTYVSSQEELEKQLEHLTMQITF